MLSILIAGIFTISVIIVVHELGHFLAARSVGIHVHRFSIGFGPVLVRWHAFSTEWAISLLPFGGYVKMAGMELAPLEGELPPEEETLPAGVLYRNKSVGKRLFAIAAGPLANLILAVLISFGVFYWQGLPTYPDVWLDQPRDGSPAALAGLQRGDKLLVFGGEEIANWVELSEVVEDKGAGVHPIRVLRGEQTLSLELEVPEEDGILQPTGLMVLFDNRVGRVLRDGPADRLGLEHGDRIVALDGQEVRWFDDIAGVINTKPGETVRIAWEREGRRFEGEVIPERDRVPDPEDETKIREIGRIFYEPFEGSYEPISLATAFKYGVLQVGVITKVTLNWLGKVVTGRGNRHSVGGPIEIFRTAGQMARWGIDRLLTFIAFFSTQLFLLNLLPIPVLDGGHIVFLTLEGVGVPVREQWRMRLTMIGMFFLLGLMALIVLGDIGRVFF